MYNWWCAIWRVAGIQACVQRPCLLVLIVVSETIQMASADCVWCTFSTANNQFTPYLGRCSMKQTDSLLGSFIKYYLLSSPKAVPGELGWLAFTPFWGVWRWLLTDISRWAFQNVTLTDRKPWRGWEDSLWGGWLFHHFHTVSVYNRWTGLRTSILSQNAHPQNLGVRLQSHQSVIFSLFGIEGSVPGFSIPLPPYFVIFVHVLQLNDNLEGMVVQL